MLFRTIVPRFILVGSLLLQSALPVGAQRDRDRFERLIDQARQAERRIKQAQKANEVKAIRERLERARNLARRGGSEALLKEIDSVRLSLRTLIDDAFNHLRFEDDYRRFGLAPASVPSDVFVLLKGVWESLKGLRAAALFSAAAAANTTTAYHDFLKGFAKTEFASEARTRRERLLAAEPSFDAFQEATARNTADAYDAFLKGYADGPLRELAESRIAEIEAGSVVSSRFEPLYQSDRWKPGEKSQPFAVNIVVSNTKVEPGVVVYLIGPESTKLTLQAGEKRVISVAEGRYRVVARVIDSKSGMMPCAGDHDYSEGDYSLDFGFLPQNSGPDFPSIAALSRRPPVSERLEEIHKTLGGCLFRKIAEMEKILGTFALAPSVGELATTQAAAARGIATAKSLREAAKAGDYGAVQAVLQRGADVNETDEAGHTPLIHAARSGHAEIVNVLLDGGADPNLKDRSGRSPLIDAAENGHIEIVKALLEKGADVNIRDSSGTTALIGAAASGKREIVKLLLEKGGAPNAGDNAGITPVMIAVWRDEPDVAQVLLDRSAEPNVKDEKGWSALMYAADMGRAEIAKILLDKRADVNAKDQNGQTALTLALRKGHAHLAELLKNAGAKE